MSWNTMEEYKEDDEFKRINPKKVDKDGKSLWRTITEPAEIKLFLLKQNQLQRCLFPEP